MKLNLYKCQAGDREWYSLAKGIRAGAIPLQCWGGIWPFDVSPDKIEFFKEVEIDVSSFLDEETKKIEEENAVLKTRASNLEREKLEQFEYVKLVWRLYFK